MTCRADTETMDNRRDTPAIAPAAIAVREPNLREGLKHPSQNAYPLFFGSVCSPTSQLLSSTTRTCIERLLRLMKQIQNMQSPTR